MLLIDTLLSSSGPFRLLITVASLALAGSARAQVCFEPPVTAPTGSYPLSVVTADLDGDGDVDVAIADVGSGVVRVFLNDGQGGLAYQAAYTVGWNPYSLTAADLDGDGDIDLAAASSYTSTISVLLNQGNGTFAPEVPYAVGQAPHCVRSADLNGDGFIDLVATATVSPDTSVLFNLGNGTFAPTVAISGGGSGENFQLADFDGDGDVDIATLCPNCHTVAILMNQGNGTFLPGAQNQVVDLGRAMASGDLDSDGDVDLVVGTRLEPPAPGVYGSVWVYVNSGNGTFAPHLIAGPTGSVNAVTIADLNGDGLPDIATSSDAALVLSVWLNQGNGVFGNPVSVAGGELLADVTHADMDADGDQDLVAASRQPAGARVLRNCSISGTAVCAGDGSGTTCPCGNSSPPGSFAGCLNSSALAGTLRGTGSATLSNDQLVLVGTGVQNSSGLYFQGTNAVGAGAGVVFGDGLRCAGGTVQRLGIKTAASHASQYPGSGDQPVSLRGAVGAPGQRFYQVWYRDPASFCTPSTFNLTNALAVTWAP